MSIYALLVGVNDYLNPRINPLQGCENDIDLVADTLDQRFGVPEDNIIKLKSGHSGEEASRQNIIDCFYKHLIDKAQQDDVAIFYFSGHGAQSATHPDYLHVEPDGLDESLVCYDSRQSDIPDLRDKDLRYLIAELGKRCDHISVFLDCCHSAGGTRVIEHEKVQARVAPVDKQSYHNTPYLHLQGRTRSVGGTGGVNTALPVSGKHVLLSGCRDYQLSEETILGVENKRHGRFTHALCNVLNTIHYPISYHELRSRVHTAIHRKQKDQSPQLEVVGGADKRSTVFGGELLPLSFIASYRDDVWRVNAGAIHGYSKGDIVSLFLGEGEGEAGPIAVGVLEKVAAHESVFGVVEGGVDSDGEFAASVAKEAFNPIGVQAVGADPQLLIDLNNALSEVTDPRAPGRYLQIDSIQPLYEIHHDQRGYYAVQPSVNPQPAFTEQPDLHSVLTQLSIMARWWEKFNLQNSESKLAQDAVDLVLTYEGKEYHSEDVNLDYVQDAEGGWIMPAFTLELRLRPNYPANKKLYCSVLFFDGSSGEITSLLQTDVLTNGDSYMEGGVNKVTSIKIREGEEIQLQIMPELLAGGVEYVEDYVKLFISSDGFDASILEQDGNELYVESSVGRNSWDTYFQTVLDGYQYRSLGGTRNNADYSDWFARDILVSLTARV